MVRGSDGAGRLHTGLLLKNGPNQIVLQDAKGDKIKGNIKSITDFGIFIGLDGGIDGLVHLSDISWNEQGETAVRRACVDRARAFDLRGTSRQ